MGLPRDHGCHQAKIKMEPKGIMVYAYADQNFLSTCAEKPSWREVVVRARTSEKASLVLSPLHFLEIGKAKREVRESILELVEVACPSWTFTPADAQLRQCTTLWDAFRGLQVPPFASIVTMHEAAAAMHRVHPSKVAKHPLSDWVTQFSTDSGVADPLSEINETMSEQRHVSASNRQDYREGRLTPSRMRNIDRNHVAVQLARRSVGDIEHKLLYAAATTILQDRRLLGLIDSFLDTHGSNKLTCYRVEAEFTTEIWEGNATLSPGRLVDRQHACVGMPFCDVFVTDDKDLTKRCEYAKRNIKFNIAAIQQGESFLQSL